MRIGGNDPVATACQRESTGYMFIPVLALDETQRLEGVHGNLSGHLRLLFIRREEDIQDTLR